MNQHEERVTLTTPNSTHGSVHFRKRLLFASTGLSSIPERMFWNFLRNNMGEFQKMLSCGSKNFALAATSLNHQNFIKWIFNTQSRKHYDRSQFYNKLYDYEFIWNSYLRFLSFVSKKIESKNNSMVCLRETNCKDDAKKYLGQRTSKTIHCTI